MPGQVISASRRTDIPAFYGEWFVNRLEERSAVVLQPYNGKPARVSLAPADVSAIVFWSKHYGPFLGLLEAVERTTKNLFFHCTITGNRELERAVPEFRDVCRDLAYLAGRYGPDRVVWRFDPLCITDRDPFEVHLERFHACAGLLRGAVRECIISFVHPYKKVMTNLAKYSDQRLIELQPQEQALLARRLAAVAETYGMRLAACCNDYLLSPDVAKASCIDGRRLAALSGVAIDQRPARSRKECACTRSVDIGAYDTCGHGCLYCYANSDPERARKTLGRHDPSWNALQRQVPEFGEGDGGQLALLS